MKISAFLMVSLLGGAVLGFSGCGKDQNPPPTPPPTPATDAAKPASTPDTAKAAQDAAQAAKDAAAKASQDAAAAAKAAQDAAAKAAADAAAAKAQAAGQEVQAKLDQAKKLITDKKYPDALALLQQLLNLALTNEQKAEADALIAQVKKAMAGDALKSGGGLLK